MNSAKEGRSAAFRLVMPAWAPVLSGNVIQLVLAFLTSVIVARSLGAADFGVYAVLGVAATVLGVLLDFGISDVAVVRLATARQSRDSQFRERASAFFCLRAGIALAVCLPAGIFAATIAETLLGLAGQGFRLQLVLAGAFAVACNGALTSIIQSQGRFRALASLPILNSALSVVLAALLAFSGRFSIEMALVWLGIVPTLAAGVLARVLVGSNVGLRPPPSFFDEARALLRQGRWLWAASISAVLASRIDLLAVQRWGGPASTGSYALAASLAGRSAVVNGSIYTVLIPRAATIDSSAEMKKYLRDGAIRSSAIATLLVIGIVIADPLIAFVYGPEFRGATVLLRGLLVVAIVDTFALPLAPLAIAFRRTALIGYADGVKLGVFVVVAFVALPVLGPLGAVLARFAASLASVVPLLLALRRPNYPEREQS